MTFVAYNNVEALEAELAAGEPAAVVVEPIQAEGGVIIPAEGYLTAVRELCDRHGAFLILDEVQTGLGRLGSWWGADRDGVTPDVLLVGKGLSGGCVPVAGVVATADAFRSDQRGPPAALLHLRGQPARDGGGERCDRDDRGGRDRRAGRNRSARGCWTRSRRSSATTRRPSSRRFAASGCCSHSSSTRTTSPATSCSSS